MPNSYFNVHMLFKLVVALILLVFAGFAVFGFLAAGELSEPAEQLPWRVGYTILGLASLCGIAAILRPRSSSNSRLRESPASFP